MRTMLKLSLVAACALSIVACKNGQAPPSTKLADPVFVALQTPGALNGWDMTTVISPAPTVLPTRGRGVRIDLTAPPNSQFAVSIRSGGAAVVALPKNTGTPAAPDAGYFQVMSASGTAYRLYVRAPATLADNANYAIDIVNQSARTDVADSGPLTIALTRRATYTVAVLITGNGRVVSSPAGIQCGRSPNGNALSPCSATFPVETTSVTLNANSNDGRLIGWTGDCTGDLDNACELTFNATSGFDATAHFGDAAISSVPACPTGAPLAGMRWVAIPDCASGSVGYDPTFSHPALCDSGGFFCCSTRAAGAPPSGSTRCMGNTETAPDCRGAGLNASLRQPGGCYENAP
jgi:hypothetical protein